MNFHPELLWIAALMLPAVIGVAVLVRLLWTCMLLAVGAYMAPPLAWNSVAGFQRWQVRRQVGSATTTVAP